ncbi:MAG: hypothetical protein AAF591_07115 [Verrucomicrobiota bacterium]
MQFDEATAIQTLPVTTRPLKPRRFSLLKPTLAKKISPPMNHILPPEIHLLREQRSEIPQKNTHPRRRNLMSRRDHRMIKSPSTIAAATVEETINAIYLR